MFYVLQSINDDIYKVPFLKVEDGNITVDFVIVMNIRHLVTFEMNALILCALCLH